MRRRRLLQVTAAVTAFGGVAGCIEDGGDRGGEPNDGTDDGTDGMGGQPDANETTDPDGTGTPDPGGSQDDSKGTSDQTWDESAAGDGFTYSFTSRNPECGQEDADTADVEFRPDADEVLVTGVITGSDLCKRATVGSGEYDADAAALAVDVGTTPREACGDEGVVAGQCIVEIEYELTVSFEDGFPDGVTVSHDGRELGEFAPTSGQDGD